MMHPTQEIAGKTVRFEVTIQELKEKILPELDDEFAKEVRSLDTLAELRTSLRQQLEKNEQHKVDQEIRQQLSDKLYDLVPMELPAKAVDVEVDQMLGQLQYQFQSQGLKLDASSFNTPEIRAEYRSRENATCACGSSSTRLPSRKTWPWKTRRWMRSTANLRGWRGWMWSKSRQKKTSIRCCSR